MADGTIKIDTSIDTKGAEKGLKSLKTRLGELSDNKQISGIANIGSILGGLGVVAGVAAKAIKGAGAVVKDFTDTYKVQAAAEVQLTTAAKNNPYLDAASVAALKNYASELQSISTVGDEEILPYMAQLASAGRTQDEIMQIMATSLDIAASGSMSLESAVRNLNKTYGGYAGELGETIPAVKNLTQEQLKSGEAVKVMAAQYKGMAKEVAAATGTSEQLSNSWGDFKEEMGRGLEEDIAPMRKSLQSLIDKMTAAHKAAREEAGAIARINGESSQPATLTDYMRVHNPDGIEFEERLLNEYKTVLALMKKSPEVTTEAVKEQEYVVATFEARVAELKKVRKTIGDLGWKEYAEAQRKKAEPQLQKEVEIAQKRAEAEQSRAEYIAANTAAREKELAVLETQAVAEGRSVESSEKLNVYIKSYVDLLQKTPGLVSAADAESVRLLDTTRDIATEMEKTEKGRKALEALTADIDSVPQSEEKQSDIYAAQINLMEEHYQAAISFADMEASEKERIETEYTAAHQRLCDLRVEAEENELAAEEEARRKTAEKNATIANQFASQYAEIMNGIAELAAINIEAEATDRMATLEDQYSQGLISQEEYEKEKAKIEYDAAKKKHQLELMQWTANIATAIANTALGITQALSQGPVGMVMAGLIGAAGAIQLATIIANKPIPPTAPSFATGGIVGGTSYTGDKIHANVNSGEMILNARQQRNMFDAINAGSARLTNGSGCGFNGGIKIYNSAANDVTASPQITEGDIKIMIRRTVNKDMNDGRFNDSLQSAQQQFAGTRYTN